MLDTDEIDNDCIEGEISRRKRVASENYSTEEHALFARLYQEEYKTVYVDERDWEPDELRDKSERALRYRRWSEDCRKFPNAMRWQYGDDYQAKVTEILKEWDATKAAKLMRISEDEAAKRLEIALSDRWKER